MNIVKARRKMGEFTAERDFTRRVWDSMPDAKYGWELINNEVPEEVKHLFEPNAKEVALPKKPGRKAATIKTEE